MSEISDVMGNAVECNVEGLTPQNLPIHDRTKRRKNFKYLVEEKDDKGEVVFRKKYKCANEITNELPLLNKDRVSDMVNGRYKYKKKTGNYEILKNIRITKIQDSAYTTTENPSN